MESNKGEQAISRKIPLTRWPEFHPWPSVAGLRHLVNNSNQNGFNKVILRAGRRILLDEKLFFEWLESQPNGVKKMKKSEKSNNT